MRRVPSASHFVLRSGHRIAAFAAMLALAGCGLVGPDYVRQPPATPPTPDYKETSDDLFRPAQPRDTVDRGPWWTIYGDPTLDQLTAQVEVSNQTLKQNEAAYRQAVALIRQSQSGLYPTLGYTGGLQQSGRGSGSSTNASNLTAGGNSVAQYSLGGTLNWPIDVWGNIRRQIESDSAAAQASYGTLAAARLSAQSALVTNYYSLRVSDERARLLQATTAAYAKALEIVRNQATAGTVSALNVAQAEAQYQQTRAQLVAEGVTRAQFEHAIAALIGKQPAEFSLPPEKISDDVPTIEAGVPSALLERRPDIASAERSMAAANAQIGVAVGAYYPQFTLTASINFVSTMLNNLLQIANAVWAIGPQLAGTLLDGGARAAQVEQARANFDATVANYRQTVITAFQQVEDALASQRILEQQEKVQRLAVAAARKAEATAINQYRAGTVDYTTVVQTQTVSLQNEQTLLNIRLARYTASSNLIAAIGGGWRDSDLPPPVYIPGIETGRELKKKSWWPL
jgi:NodT family efflux transporter outer membrane factor (OMF) lipoprotein